MHAKFCAVVLAALSLEGALAFPSIHRHEHKRAAVTKRDDWESKMNWNDPANYKGVDFNKINYGGGAAAPAAAGPKADTAPKAETPAVAAPKDDTSSTGSVVAAAKKPSSGGSSRSSGSSNSGKSSGSSSSSGTDNNGCGPGFGGVTPAIGSLDVRIGNVGSPFGSNMQSVDSKDGYKYTNTFINNSPSEKTIILWLKSSPDTPGTHNTGQFGPAAKTIQLAGNSQQIVAFDVDTQPVACDWTSKSKTSYGAFDCVYAEMDFGNADNNGYSGFDVSQIQSGPSGEGSCNVSMTGAGQTSSCSSNGYAADGSTAAVGGIGGNVAPGPLHIQTTYS